MTLRGVHEREAGMKHGRLSVGCVLAAIDTLRLAWRKLTRRIDSLWGYDVFMDHPRADAAAYAQARYAALQREQISSFIDRVVYGPGDSLLIATPRHVTKSTLFLLVGSPEILKSRQPVDWLKAEIETYLESHKEDPTIIIVDVGGVVEAALASPGAKHYPILDRLEPFLRLHQEPTALADPPNDAVIEAIQRHLRRRRRDRSRLRLYKGVAAALAELNVLAVALELARGRQRTCAGSRRLVAEARTDLSSPPGTQTPIRQARAAPLMADTPDSRSGASEVLAALPIPSVVLDASEQDGGVSFGALLPQ